MLTVVTFQLNTCCTADSQCFVLCWRSRRLQSVLTNVVHLFNIFAANLSRKVSKKLWMFCLQSGNNERCEVQCFLHNNKSISVSNAERGQMTIDEMCTSSWIIPSRGRSWSSSLYLRTLSTLTDPASVETRFYSRAKTNRLTEFSSIDKKYTVV